MVKNLKSELVAPCGMNCRICVAFFGYTMSGKKRKMNCLGCNPSGKSCAHLKKHCEILTKKEIDYCYECNYFPCKQIRKLDSKYRKRFDMSTIANLRFIEENGMEKFLQQQEARYKCPKCGGIICVHNGRCYNCNSLQKKNFKASK